MCLWFSLATNDFTLEGFNLPLSDIRLESSFHGVELFNHFCPFPINNFIYYTFRNFISMHITMFLEEIIKTFLRKQRKHILESTACLHLTFSKKNKYKSSRRYFTFRIMNCCNNFSSKKIKKFKVLY